MAGLAVKHALLRRVPPSEKRLALVFSAYPTKHSRIGNAVGLDTPASAIVLLKALQDNGYRIGEVPGLDAADGDALMHGLIERGGQDPDWLTEGQLAGNPIRIPAARYREWFADLPTDLADAVVQHWGPPPGICSSIAVRRRPANRRRGNSIRENLVILVQPPAASGRTRLRSTTTPTCRRVTIIWPPICGFATSSVPTPSCTSASTATWSGCLARPSGCRRTAVPTPPWAIFR